MVNNNPPIHPAAKNFTILDAYTVKYGFYSVATLLLKYFNLIDLIDNRLDEEKLDLSTVTRDFSLSAAIALIQDHYFQSGTATVKGRFSFCLKEISFGDYSGKQFDRRIFVENYLSNYNCNKEYIKKLNSSTQTEIQANSFYIYAINKDLQVKIFTKALPLDDVIISKRIHMVNHAELVFEDDLIALSAGEVIFVKKKNSPNVEVAIINNKSGHYQPDKESLAYARQAFSKALGIPRHNIIAFFIER